MKTGENENKYDILENFSLVMGRVGSRFTRGLGAYMLKTMDHTVQTAALSEEASDHFLDTFKNDAGRSYIMFSSKAAGLNSTPRYLKKKLAHPRSLLLWCGLLWVYRECCRQTQRLNVWQPECHVDAWAGEGWGGNCGGLERHDHQ